MQMTHPPRHSPVDKFWVSRQLYQCQGEDDSQTTKEEEEEEEKEEKKADKEKKEREKET